MRQTRYSISLTILSLLVCASLVVAQITPAPQGHIIRDEGTQLPQHPYLNFTGPGIACTTDSANRATKCTIAGAALPASYAVGDLLYADTTTSLARLAAIGAGGMLVSNGVGVAPSWTVTPTTGSLTLSSSSAATIASVLGYASPATTSLVYGKFANLTTTGRAGLVLGEDNAAGTPFYVIRYNSAHAATPLMVDIWNASNGSMRFGTNNTLALTLTTGQAAQFAGTLTATGGVIPRVVSLADATSITPTAGTADQNIHVNTQAVGTLTVNAPSGTPVDSQILTLRIKSTNVQTYSWNAVYRGSTGLSLPVASTGGGKTDYYNFRYNLADTVYDFLAQTPGY